jgi:hypothetical protein
MLSRSLHSPLQLVCNGKGTKNLLCLQAKTTQLLVKNCKSAVPGAQPPEEILSAAGRNSSDGSETFF